MSRLKIPVMALEPSLWGTLPKELLHLVFARLPVAGIGKLRVLSKKWKRSVDCKDSEFNQVFDATAHLNMFALLSWPCYGTKPVFGNIYDVQADKWHGYEAGTMEFDGVDGGLVCCVSNGRWFRTEKPGLVIMINPLTKQKTLLPPLLECMEAKKSNIPAMHTIISMVKLTVDKKTKEYKVFVVTSIRSNIENGVRGFFATVYDSHVKEWTVVEAAQGHIIGWSSLDYDCDFGFPSGLSVYNCADKTLQEFNETNIAPGLEVGAGCWVLIEDHLFVLHKETSLGPADLSEDGAGMLQKYSISEFHLPEKTTAWVKLRVHSCDPCKCFRDSPQDVINSKLWGCNGFLLVYGGGFERAWLYNLSTCEWRKLPAFGKPFHPSLMCEISWSAVA